MDMEILFRGKRADNGEWLYGNLLRTDYDGTCIIQNHVPRHLLKNYEVDPKTACKYTGLADRNGRKIFEGDIVNCSEKRGAAFWRCKVGWNETKARFDVINTDCEFPMCLDSFGHDMPINGSDYEIIGNIFDNPSLLEGGAE